MDHQDSDFLNRITDAWQKKLDINELISCANILHQLKKFTLEAILYQTWLDRNVSSLNHLIYFNLGTALFSNNDYDAAKMSYLKAIEISDVFIQPHFNLGIIYEKEGRFDLAVSEWLWVINNVLSKQDEYKDIRLLALNNLGRLYESQRQYSEALFYLTKSLELEPNQPDTQHHWIFLRERLCEWPVYAPLKNITQAQWQEHTSALAMLSLSDDPAAQLQAAQQFVQKKLQHIQPLPSVHRSEHKKIRIGYVSSDLCMHPVAMLTAELFELHNKDEFEVYIYCWSREDGSVLRQRIMAAADHFIRVNQMDDLAVASMIQMHEIDILIDLHGQTLGARPAIFAYRPAPIQITYLGLPATTGFPFIDYVIADRFLIPEESQQFYSEKPLYMPDTYQVSDRQRVIAATPSKRALGLPEDKFVFCSFNNNHKYTPEVFAVWMKILQQVPESVLWLLSENPQVETNLRREAARHGVDASRLYFAPRVSPDLYYARYQLADLFLDTYPFNGGTTANDALWMALPVLTMTGHTFAARMAGALLTTAELPSLITYSLEEYEEKAVLLANNQHELMRLKSHLKSVKAHGKLFDIPLFVKNLEIKFKELIE